MLNIDISRLDLKDQRVFKWVMDKIAYISRFNKEEAEKIENQLIDDKLIGELLDGADEILPAFLFSRLPPERFLSNIETLITKWPECTGLLAYATAPVIAQLEPEKAYDLFLSYFSSAVPFTSHHKIVGILNSVKYLRDDLAKKLSHKIVDHYIQAILSVEEKANYLPVILYIAWKYEHTEFNSLIRQWFMIEEDEDYYKIVLSDLSHLLINSAQDFIFIYDHYNENTSQNYEAIPQFFKPSSPLAEIDNAIEDFSNEHYEKIVSLFNENYEVISDERVKNFLKDIVNDEKFIEELDKERKFLFYAFILGCLITSMRMSEINLEDLNFQDALNLLSADVDELPFFDDFVNFFKKENRDEVVKFLMAGLNRDKETYYGGKNIVRMMGELRYDEFLEPLLNLIKENNISHETEEALLRYEDKSFEHISKEFRNMNKYGRLSALSVIEQMGEKRLSEFTDTYFDDILLNNKEILLETIQIFPQERFIKKIEPYTNKGQISIDKTYVLLSKLLGHEGIEIDILKKNIYDYEKEMEDAHKAFEEKRFIDLLQPYIDIELRCDNCGDESYYRVKNVTVNLSEDRFIDAAVEDEVLCINCNETSEFEITQESKSVVADRIMLMMTIEDDKEKEKVIKTSPIKFTESNYGEDGFTDEEIIEFFQGRIEEEPSNADNYICLGNFYKNNKKYSKAEEYYRKAMRIDPSYAETYYSLADIAFDRHKYKSAFELLDKGKTYLQIGKYRQDFEGVTEFIKNYNDFYEDMLDKSRETLIPVEPSSVSLKVGRNDPCSCGSGKKYKKCCLIQKENPPSE